MKAFIQRVSEASVRVEGQVTGQIEKGLLILLGVGSGDYRELADQLALKISRLRIFEDEKNKMNRSLADIHGEALVVSQFTLYADCRKGNRPSFTGAAAPELANELYVYFCEALRNLGVPVQTGIFGADMKVSLINDGPVTILLEKSPEVS